MARNCSAAQLHYVNSLGFKTVARIFYSDCKGKYKLSENKKIHECAIAVGKSLRNNYRSEKDRKAEISKIPYINTEEFCIESFIE